MRQPGLADHTRRPDHKLGNQVGGLLVKIPKKNQSKYIDLPVIGVKTLKLIKKANLNGILINHRFTLIHNKPKFLEYAQNNNLKIYSLLK